jgi:GDSL-like lipase/acylhydrolase family protein
LTHKGDAVPHVVLLGDSIFDNARYTAGGPAVIRQVSALVPAGWRASLLAVDGSIAKHVSSQMARLPRDATHLVLSVGGNDALGQTSIFESGASSAAEVLWRLADIADGFEKNYRTTVETCLRPGLPLAVCTIYNGCFLDPSYQRLASVALMVFNDVIIRTAAENSLPVIDLRSICNRPEDYANPIEPSSIGGEKIARAITVLITKEIAPRRCAYIVAA